MAATRTCGHVLANGELCAGPALRDSNLCYWHHKARYRQLHRGRGTGRLQKCAKTGIILPLLEDGNAIQIGLQEVMHALLDGRLDTKRAGLLLYGLQVATTNLCRLRPKPWQNSDRIASIGADRLGTDELDA